METLILVRAEANAVGNVQILREVEVHELRGEARGGEEFGQLAPPPSSVAGLLLELATRREIRVFRAALIVRIQRAGRHLEEQPLRGAPVLPDEEDVVIRIEREDRNRSRVPGDIAGRTGAVRSFDRVDPERQVPATVEDPGVDDALDESSPGVIIRGRT